MLNLTSRKRHNNVWLLLKPIKEPIQVSRDMDLESCEDNILRGRGGRLDSAGHSHRMGGQCCLHLPGQRNWNHFRTSQTHCFITGWNCMLGRRQRHSWKCLLLEQLKCTKRTKRNQMCRPVLMFFGSRARRSMVLEVLRARERLSVPGIII